MIDPFKDALIKAVLIYGCAALVGILLFRYVLAPLVLSRFPSKKTGNAHYDALSDFGVGLFFACVISMVGLYITNRLLGAGIGFIGVLVGLMLSARGNIQLSSDTQNSLGNRTPIWFKLGGLAFAIFWIYFAFMLTSEMSK
jgi:hypothetical protein